MENIENAVGTETVHTPADDAQAAGASAEVTVEEVMEQLNATREETADAADAADTGDGGPGAQQHSKRDNQMRAALRQQRRTIFEKDLGMSEEQVRELIRAHRQAQANAQSEPEAQDAAAQAQEEAIRAEQAVQETGEETPAADATQEQREDITALFESGWTREELLEFARDEQAMRDVVGGMRVSDAAAAYRARRTPQPRKAAPVARAMGAGTPANRSDMIAGMDDDSFDALMSDLRRRAMRREKVRI